MKLTDSQIIHVLETYVKLVTEPVSDTEKKTIEEVATKFLYNFDFQMTNRLAWYNSLKEFGDALSVLVRMNTTDHETYEYTNVIEYLTKEIVPNFSAIENTPTFTSAYESNTMRDLLWSSINEKNKNIGIVKKFTDNLATGASLGSVIQEETMTDTLISSIEEVAKQSGVPVEYKAGSLNNTQKVVQSGVSTYTDYKGSQPQILKKEIKGTAPVSSLMVTQSPYNDKALYTSFNTSDGPVIVATNSIESAQNINDIKSVTETLTDYVKNSQVKLDTGTIEKATEDIWVNLPSSGNQENKDATPTKETSNAYYQKDALAVKELNKADNSFESLSDDYTYSSSLTPATKNWGLHIVADKYKDSADRGLPSEVYILQRPNSIRSLGVSGNWTHETFQGGQFPHSYYEKHDTSNEISLSINLHQQEYPDQPLTEIVEILQDFTRPYEYSNTSLEPKPVTIFTMGQVFTGYLKSVSANYEGDDYTLWNDNNAVGVNPTSSDYKYGFSSASVDITFFVEKQITLRQVPDIALEDIDLSGYKKGALKEDGTYEALDENGNVVGFYDAQGNLHLVTQEAIKAEEEAENKEFLKNKAKLDFSFDNKVAEACANNASFGDTKLKDYYYMEDWAVNFKSNFLSKYNTLKSDKDFSEFLKKAEEFISWNDDKREQIIKSTWKKLELDIRDQFSDETMEEFLAKRSSPNKTFYEHCVEGKKNWNQVRIMVGSLKHYYLSLYNLYINCNSTTGTFNGKEQGNIGGSSEIPTKAIITTTINEVEESDRASRFIPRSKSSLQQAKKNMSLLRGLRQALMNYDMLSANPKTGAKAETIKLMYYIIQNKDLNFYQIIYKLKDIDSSGKPVYIKDSDEHDKTGGWDIKEYLDIDPYSLKVGNRTPYLSSSDFDFYFGDNGKNSYNEQRQWDTMELSDYEKLNSVEAMIQSAYVEEQFKNAKPKVIGIAPNAYPQYVHCYWISEWEGSLKEDIEKIINIYNEAIDILNKEGEDIANKQTENAIPRRQKENYEKFFSFDKFITDYFNKLNNIPDIDVSYVKTAQECMSYLPEEARFSFYVYKSEGLRRIKRNSVGEEQEFEVDDSIELSYERVTKYTTTQKELRDPVQLIESQGENFNIYLIVPNFWSKYGDAVKSKVDTYYEKAKALYPSGDLKSIKEEDNPWLLLVKEVPSLLKWTAPEEYKFSVSL